MIIIKSEIEKIKLDEYVKYIHRSDHKNIFLTPPGVNHYYLLAYLSSIINDALIIELGTHHGTSSLALSINKSNKIVTYDVNDFYGVHPQPNNVTRKIGNIFNLQEESALLKSNLIFLDTAHTGDFEWKVYDYLVQNNYKGILVLDDIHWNSAMKQFWSKINTTKYDVTDIGHGVCPNGDAGTGIVDFSGELIIK